MKRAGKSCVKLWSEAEVACLPLSTAQLLEVLLTYNSEWVNVASTAETLVKRRECCDRENLLSVAEWCSVVRSKEVEVGS